MKLINKKKLVSILLTILIIFLIGYYLYTNRDIFLEINSFKAIYSIPIIILIFCSLYLNGLFLKIFTDPFNILLKEHFLLSIATSFFNLITPLRAGMGVRAIYLKKRYNLDYTKFMAGFFGNYVIIMLITSISAILTFGIIFLKTGKYNHLINLIFVIIFIFCLFLIFYNKQIKETGAISKKINLILKGWTSIVKHPKLIFSASIITILNLLCTSAIIFTIFTAIDQKISFLQSFFYSIISILTFFINITPGSIGITEGLYIISGNILTIKPEISLLVALIYRLFATIILLSAGPIANLILIKKLKKSSKN